MMKDVDSRLFFSDDRTAFAIKTDKGIYINLSGKSRRAKKQRTGESAMRNAKKHDFLKREEKAYEVICADGEYFIIAPTVGGHTDFEHLEAYSNDSRIMSLKGLKFERVEPV